MPEPSFIELFKSARRVNTSLLAVRTPDPIATMASIIENTPDTTPILIWDIVRGLVAPNDAGAVALKEITKGKTPAMLTNPVDALRLMATTLPNPKRGPGGEELPDLPLVPPRTIIFFMNAQRYISSTAANAISVIQGIWNLREAYKENFRQLVMIGTTMPLPPELAQDVIVLDDPFPDDKQLETIVERIYASSKDAIEVPDKDQMTKYVVALRGLSAYTAEQVGSMSLTAKGIDLDQLRERSYKVIEETPALSVWREKVTFNDVRGCDNAKNFFTGIFKGRETPDLIVFWDEVEKVFAGAKQIGGDSSGVSQQQHKTVLQWMQDKKIMASLFVGHPGAAKTILARAIAGQFDRPLIAFDIDAAQAGIVGQTGERTRAALKTIDAIGRPLVLATSNSIMSLSAELRRRFKLGTFFFDLPTKEERDAIWDLYLKKYDLTGDRPADDGWTGAEIATCCEMAWKRKTTLLESATYIVSVARADADGVRDLREKADNTWISASYPGFYNAKEVRGIPMLAVPLVGSRKVEGLN